MIYQDTIQIDTGGRSTIAITRQVAAAVRQSSVKSGLAHVFITHTSASLIVCENADPEVRTDLERFMARLVQDGDPIFLHTAEGSDDMPAHIRSILTQTSLSIPICDGRLALGTWQGIYLWEHRTQAHTRRIIITIDGEQAFSHSSAGPSSPAPDDVRS